jgi:hypothetical protein
MKITEIPAKIEIIPAITKVIENRKVLLELTLNEAKALRIMIGNVSDEKFRHYAKEYDDFNCDIESIVKPLNNFPYSLWKGLEAELRKEAP